MCIVMYNLCIIVGTYAYDFSYIVGELKISRLRLAKDNNNIPK